MSDDARGVRPAFLSLAALFGLIVMVWGLVTGAVGAFHIYEPRYGRAEADQGDVANAFRSVYAPLLELGQTQGTVPPGSDDAFRRAAADVERQALDRAKDRGYNEAVRGALAFVVGGFVLLVGSAGAKRAADRAEIHPAHMGNTPAPVPASMARPSMSPSDGGGRGQTVTRAPTRPQAPRPRPEPPAPPPAPRASTSPVGRLQEPPDAARRAGVRRPPAPAPKPATRRPQRAGEGEGAAAPSSPPAPSGPVPVVPTRQVAPATQPAPLPPRVAPARPVTPPATPPATPPMRPAAPMPVTPPMAEGDDADAPEEPGRA